MKLQLSINRRPEGTDVALAFNTMQGDMKVTLGGVDEQLAITSLLLFAYQRKADFFVSTCMDLKNVSVNPEVSDAINQLSLLVIDLDIAGWDIPTANQHIQAKTPGMFKLVGRSTWSGYPLRRKEFDELTALAELINERVKHPEPNSCVECLRPMATTTCSTCTNITTTHASPEPTTRTTATA
jgi:hypothetical protein